MATLQFKGKNIIWNHHMSVPYHTIDLDERLSYKQDKADGNLIIEGDNLPALKSLLPQYTGSIKCIYIDPPYNTGEEGWIYNDNVNSPMIKEWIGKTVGKDDLTRHDKWLCMMAPRLKIMRDLLKNEGCIFISVDNNEYHHLRNLMDEIFESDNYVGTLIWRKKEGGGQTDDYFVTEHEYIVVYAKSKLFSWQDEKVEVSEQEFNKEDEGGKYNLVKLEKWGTGAKKEDRPTMYFSIVNPDGKKTFPVAPDGDDGRWRVGKARMENLIESSLIEWLKKDGRWTPYEKVYFEKDAIKKIKERSILYDLANTGEASNELKDFFGVKDMFSNPKPSYLIQYLLTYTTKAGDIVLDAFAGSGTTAQAVLELNEEDEGNRKFILIQMPENSEKEPKKNIARDITRERVVKVIEKKLKNKDIGFEYRRVGQPIDAETILSGQLPTYKQLAKYVYYLATGQSPKDKDIDEKKYLAGKVDHTEVYLLYTPDMEELKKMAITFEWAKEISKGNDNKKIVYAPACFMDDEYLEQFNIKFVSIPYNLFEREK